MSFLEFLKWCIGLGGGFGGFLLWIFVGYLAWYVYKLIRYGMYMLGVLIHGWPEGGYDEEDDDEE